MSTTMIGTSGLAEWTQPQSEADDVYIFPASFTQRQIWFSNEYQGPSPLYMIVGAVSLTGNLNKPALARSMQDIVMRHEPLRTGFLARDGEPYQVVDPLARLTLECIDLTGIDKANRRSEALRRAEAIARMPFDLSQAPLMRAYLLELGAEESLLVLAIHHIVADGLSFGILARELSAFYTDYAGGLSAKLPELQICFADYVAWQRTQADTPREAALLAATRDHFRDVPSLDLPTDLPRPHAFSHRGAAISLKIAANLRASATRLAGHLGTTPFTVLLAGYAMLLGKLAGQERFAIGTPFANRTMAETRELIGLFAGTVPLRIDLAGEPTGEELIARLHAELRRAQSSQHLSFAQLVDALGGARDPSRTPLFQAWFSLRPPLAPISLQGIEVTPVPLPVETAKWAFNVELAEQGEGYEASVEWATELFDRKKVEAWAAAYVELVSRLCSEPQARLATLTEPVHLGPQISPHQARLWFVDRFENGVLYPGAPTYYNMCAWSDLDAMPDDESLRMALDRLSARHEVLRTSFDEAADHPIISVRGAVVPVSVERIEGGDSRISRILEEALRPFTLSDAPMARAILQPLPDGCARLALVMHHIIADARSLRRLVGELADLVEGRGTGPAPDYRTIAPRRNDADIIYWREALRGIRPLVLPMDHSRPAIHTFTMGRADLVLPRDALTTLHEVARSRGLERVDLLRTAFVALLHLLSGETDIVHGETLVPDGGTGIGPGTNLVVIRSICSGEPALADLAAAGRATRKAAEDHGDTAFDDVVSAIKPDNDMSRTALFDVLFDYEEDNAVPHLAAAGRPRLIAESGLGWGKFDLTVVWRSRDDRLDGALIFNRDLFDEDTGARIAGLLERASTLIAHALTRTVSCLDLRRPHELDVTRREMKGIAAFSGPATITERFDAMVERFPGNCALREGERRVTYVELAAATAALASRLAAKGIRRGERVGLLMPPGMELIAGCLATLRLGAAYIPLDPSYPDDRIRYIAANARLAAVCVLSGQTGAMAQSDAPVVPVEPLEHLAQAACGSAPPAASRPEDPAYIIYTSGSTGQPKGVVIEHRSIVNLLFQVGLPFQFGPDDVWTLFHSPSFDFSVWEMYGALLHGGTLVIVPPDARLDPSRFLDLLESQGVTVLNQTPAAFYALAQEAVAGPVRSLALHTVIFGGEALRSRQLKVWHNHFPQVRLVNMYGITETTVHVTHATIGANEISAATSLIGRPLPGYGIVLVDEALLTVADGLSGEICVAGQGLAQGYWDLPELTARRFIELPEYPGQRFFRSGDRAYRRPDGQLVYIGRIDQQVKIRGFRIEPAEIETAIQAFPGIKSVVVLPDSLDGDTQALIAYFVAVGEVEQRTLADHVARTLPAYMRPARYVAVDTIPMSSNGKIDRRALAQANARTLRSAQAGATIATAGPLEGTLETIAGLWRELLHCESVSAQDDFFDLGGHSLLACRLVARVRDSLGTRLPVRAVFEMPTLASLSAEIDRLATANADPNTSISRNPRHNALALSSTQFGLWFLNRLDPETAAYNMVGAIRIEGVLDPEVLKGVIVDIQNRHETLRTRFHEVEGRPVQIVAPAARAEMEMIDLQHLPEHLREGEARRVVRELARRPFLLDIGPLLRVALLRTGRTDHVLSLAIHHIIADGWSIGVLLRDIDALYRASLAGLPSPLPPLAIQYADYVVWRERCLDEKRRRDLFAYWTKQLEGLQPLELPTDRARNLQGNDDGREVAFEIPSTLTDKLAALGHAEGTTRYVVLLAAFQVLLAHFTGQTDIAVGTPVANREHPDVQDVVGCFTNVVVIRTNLSERPSFAALVGRVRDVTLHAHEHQDLPFDQLLEAMRPERDLARPPLFQVLFSHIVDFDPPASDERLSYSPFAVDIGAAQFDLSLYIDETREAVTARLVYRTDLFDAETIERLRDRYLQLLDGASRAPGQSIARLPIITASERSDLACWNATAINFSAPETLTALLTRQAALTPDAIALESADAILTYAALDREAARLAGLLQSRGVGRDAPVGVCLDRSAQMVIALVAILKAGGCYLPLDPELPPRRLETMCQIVKPKLLLTQNAYVARLPVSTALLCLDAADTASILAAAPAPIDCVADGDSLAYVIFTSGSTGEPKGVMIPHRGIVNRLLWMQEAYRLTGSDRVLQKTPFAFDVSVWEFFWPLITGARLVLARPGGHKDPAYINRLIAQSGITTIHFVPSMLSLFLAAADAASCRSLRRVMASGEALLPEHVDRFLALGLNASLYNLYGPTEASVDVTAWTCTAADTAGIVPIGRPIANTHMYVLDEWMQELPPGIPGEIYIGGVGVATGYYARPHLTEERFVPDPFTDDIAARLFKTGDRGRWRPDGVLEYLGRLDDQVKLRGFRVELGEIEAVLRQSPDIRDSAVALFGDPGSSDHHLAAYFVPASDAEEVDVVALRSFLEERLAPYMVPMSFTVLDALPLSANGKTDRRRLPRPLSADSRQGRNQPATSTQRRVAEIWHQVLGRDRIDINQNFFDAGGNSLLLARVSALLRQRISADFSLADLFRFPTIAALADHLDRHGGAVTPPGSDAAAVGRPVRSPSDGIAIVAMAGRFPGADTVDIFWRNLCDGIESVVSLDRDSLRAEGVPDAVIDDPRYVPATAPLVGIELFDAEFFGYSPRDASYLDPQGRLFLECSYEALERAGCVPERGSSNIGVFAGCSVSTYALAARSWRGAAESVGDALQFLVGNDKDYLASRTAYKLGLTGPAIGVQTACSTSAVAVHMACRALLDGECDAALAGGASVSVPHRVGYMQEEGAITSPDGRCRAFDVEANGTVPGSGVAVVLLKRLADAVADGNHIHAVIRASAINNDGQRKVGFTAPSIDGQTAVIAAAHSSMGCEPDSIGYVETHGTGTPLGDMVEIAALKSVFAKGQPSARCAIGSLKTNIGHLDAAAGVAGLIKAALAVEHGLLPPSLNHRTANPALGLDDSPLYVNTTLRRWDAERGPRRAAVSSFGIGGTNAHIVIEEVALRPRDAADRDGNRLLLLSALTNSALDEACLRLADHLDSHPEQELGDVAFTLQAGRRHFPLRRTFVCRDHGSGAAALRNFAAHTTRQPDEPLPLLFVFAGEDGSPGATRALTDAPHPVLIRHVEECLHFLDPSLGKAVRTEIYRSGTWREAGVGIAVLARFVADFAIAQTWLTLGLAPTELTGKGTGFVAAACVAGVIRPEDALRLLTLAWPAGNAGHPDVRFGDQVRHLLTELPLSRPRSPLLHDATGDPIGAEATDPRYWLSRLGEAGRFSASSLARLKRDRRVILQISPGPHLCGTGPATSAAQALCVCSIAEGAGSSAGLLQSAGLLWGAGFEFEWTAFHPGAHPHRVPLPTYPFQRQRFWLPVAAPGGHLPDADTPAGAEADRGLLQPVWRRQHGDHDGLPIETGPWLLAGDGTPLWGRIAELLRKGGAELTEMTVDDGPGFAANWKVPAGCRILIACSGDNPFGRAAALAKASIRGDWTANIGFVTTGGCDVIGTEPLSPLATEVQALAHVLPQEAPGIMARTIDIDGSCESTAKRLLALLHESIPEPVVAIRQGNVWLPDFVPWRGDGTGSLLRDGGVYLITGGFGRMGTAFAKHLATSRRARLILVGRRIDEGTVSALRALGVEVLPIAADVSCSEALRSAIAQGVSAFGKLNGVIHTAAVVDASAQRPIETLDDNWGADIMHTKVATARALVDASDGSWDFCLFCSSLSTVLGGFGFASYAAANHHLDALAQQRCRIGGTRFISVDWDGWDFEGHSRQQIGPDQGIALFEQILTGNRGGRLIAAATPLQPRLERFVRGMSRPRPERKPAETTPVGNWSTRFERAVAGAWEEFLGVGSVTLDDDFFQLGGHSLAATQIVHRLRRELGLPVTLSMALACPTVPSLAAELRTLVATADMEEGTL
jgi:amino acid adenylation domain-containing protein